MSNAAVFGLIALIIGAYWLIQTAIGKTTDAASRQLLKKSTNAGRAVMKRTLTFDSPVSVEELGRRIVEKVNAHPTAPALVGGLYLYQRSQNLIVFAWGSKVGSPRFRARVDLSTSSLGSKGSFSIIDWTESGGGVVYSQADVNRLYARVQNAVAEVGGATREGAAA